MRLSALKFVFTYNQFVRGTRTWTIPKTSVKPTGNVEHPSSKILLDKSDISLLEKLSLVKCDTKEGVKVLEDSISFADRILHIDTSQTLPMVTVLEAQNLNLREDQVKEGKCQDDILRNAALVEEDYFVAPPGNIPLQETSEN